MERSSLHLLSPIQNINIKFYYLLVVENQNRRGQSLKGGSELGSWCTFAGDEFSM